jgi:gliding motility-associated-like protein
MKLFLSLLCTVLAVSGLRSTNPTFVNGKDIFGTRIFIENKGQFANPINNSSPVFFVYEHGRERIYFTDEGLIYEFIKEFPLTEKQRESLGDNDHIKIKPPKIALVSMRWVDSKPSLIAEGIGRQDNYFTYGGPELNSHGYKKILYRNVYPGIDIEYTLPADSSSGIKYSIIVQPGTDPSVVKITYEGDVSKIKETKDGSVRIKTPLEDIIEFAPFTFYEDSSKVASEFRVKNKIIGFHFPNGFNKDKKMIIDPFVTITNTASVLYGYDVDYDNNGNLFVYGYNGVLANKISKFNSSGTLLWTFSGIISSLGFTLNPNYTSNFVVIKTNGKCYTGEGFNMAGTRIIRLNASGNYDNMITSPFGTWRELWDMAYHCSTGKVYGMGGSTSSTQSAGILNQLTGNLTPIAFVMSNTNTGHDVVCHAIDDAGDFFWVYASAWDTVSNKIAKINSIFTSTVWLKPTTFNTLVEATNKNYPGGSATSNGFNCLGINPNYLFYYDGANLAAYNKMTGAIVASTVVTGLNVKNQGGIAVDNCNNIYLGGKNDIRCYNFNGTTFNPLAPISLGAINPTLTTYVCDILLDKGNNLLYVSGREFVGVYNAVHSNTCTAPSLVCVNPFPLEYAICSGGSATITPVNYYSLTNATYSLSPGGLSNTTGSFVVSPPGFSTYTAYITGTNSSSAVVTYTTLVYVIVYPQPVISPSYTYASCTSSVNAFNLNLTFTPSVSNYTVYWSAVPNTIISATQTAASNVNPGIYSPTVLATSGCSVVTSFTFSPAGTPANFNINPPGGNYLINCQQPTLNIAFNPPSFNYTCSHLASPPLTGNTVSFTGMSQMGTWTCTAQNPVSGCIKTQTFNVGINMTTPSSTVIPTSLSINCSTVAITTVSAIVSGGNSAIHQWMSPLGGTVTMSGSTTTFVPGAPGVYKQCVMDSVSKCSTCKNFSVTSTAGFPTFSLSSLQNFTLGCSSKSIANISIKNAQTTPQGGALSYTILPPGSNGTLPSGTLSGISTYTVNVPGTWTIVTRANANQCDTKVQATIQQNTIAPTLTVNVPYQILTCDKPAVTLEGMTSTSDVSFTWFFPAVPGTLAQSTISVPAKTISPTNTVVANYTITAFDNNNSCISSSVVPVYQNIFVPNAVISGDKIISCKTPTVMLTNSGSTTIPPELNPYDDIIGYRWEGPSPLVPVQLNSTYIGSEPGTYTLVVKDLNNGCFGVATKTIDDGRNYPVVNTPDAPPPFVLDCNMSSVKITPIISNPLPSYTYSWDIVPGPHVSGYTTATLTTNRTGAYAINVTDFNSGCSSTGIVDVVQGTLTAAFEPDIINGFAPLIVNFSNKSTSTINSRSITSVWNFGNGNKSITDSAAVAPQAYYSLPGTYSVILWTSKGQCLDSTVKIINVEIPSALSIPNIFSPNGDNVNDYFFLKLANISQLEFRVFDRWGHMIYEVNSGSNISWDGKNQYGKEVAEGVYFYTVTARGKDAKEFEMKGNITLVR